MKNKVPNLRKCKSCVTCYNGCYEGHPYLMKCKRFNTCVGETDVCDDFNVTEEDDKNVSN